MTGWSRMAAIPVPVPSRGTHLSRTRHGDTRGGAMGRARRISQSGRPATTVANAPHTNKPIQLRGTLQPWLAVGPQSSPARDPPWAYIKAKRRSHAVSCGAVRDGAGAVRDVGAGSASVGPWSGAAGAAPVQRHHSDTGAAGESRFD